MRYYLLFIIFLLLLTKVNAQQSCSGKYKIVWKDGSSRIVRGSIIYVYKGGKTKYLFISKKDTIIPAQTQSITRLGWEDSLKGLPDEDKRYWLFKTIKGKISAYSVLPNGRGLAYLEKDSTRIPFTVENLLPLLKDNTILYKRYERTVKLVNRQQVHPNRRLVGATLYVAGVMGICIYSLSAPQPLGTLIDVAAIGTTIILYSVQASRLYPLEAIRIYNYRYSNN